MGSKNGSQERAQRAIAVFVFALPVRCVSVRESASRSLRSFCRASLSCCSELRFVQRVCVSNAQDCFFAKLVAAMNTTHDQFQRMRGLIPFPDPFASGLDLPAGYSVWRDVNQGRPTSVSK